jgi:hypothetical protein
MAQRRRGGGQSWLDVAPPVMEEGVFSKWCLDEYVDYHAADDRWHQMTDFKKPKNGPSDGYTGVAFTLDGGKAVWAEMINGNVFANAFGLWRLYIADFHVPRWRTPLDEQERHHAGRSEMGRTREFLAGRQAYSYINGYRPGRRTGSGSWSLDIYSGALRTLTPNTLRVWDEHGFILRMAKN